MENELRDKDLKMEEGRGRIEELNIKRMSLIEDNKFLNGEIDKSLDIINELNLIRKEV